MYLLLALVLGMIGALWFSCNEEPMVSSSSLDGYTKEEIDPKEFSYRPWVYATVTIIVVGGIIYYLSGYLPLYPNDNNLDPAVRPLWLPSYAGIEEIYPSGFGREEIISNLKLRSLSLDSTEELLSPVTPSSVMRGYWE